MNNWRLLLFAVVAVLLPVGSFTERNLFDGREQCCDHRPDIPEARLHGTYRKSTQEDLRLSTRLLVDHSDSRDTRRHETRYGDPVTHSSSGQGVSERSVRNQERQQRNFPEFRLSRIAISRRDLTRNDRVFLDFTRRNILEDTRSERRTRDADLNRNFRTGNERRMSTRTERSEIRKDAKPAKEFIQNELRLQNERLVLRLRENRRDSRYFRTSEERRELRRMVINAEKRQLRDSRESVERDIRNDERVAQNELELKRINRDMRLGRPQQQRSDNRQSRDTEFIALRENLRREEQRHLSRDPLDSGALRMREIRSLERLERVRDSRDVRIDASSNERLEQTSERSRMSEDRMLRRFRAEPQRTASISRVTNAKHRLEAPRRSNVRKDKRLEIRNRGIENRAVSRNLVRKDSALSRRFNVVDRAEKNYESERRITNARDQTEIIYSRISEERRETRRMSPDDSTRVAQIVRVHAGIQGERTRDEVRSIAQVMRERSDIRNFQNSETARDRRAAYDRYDSRTEFRLSRERSSLERNINLDARNTLSVVRNVRDNEREVTRVRRSVDDRSDSRREFRVSRERSSLERNSNLDARNTLPAVRNVRDNEREVTRDRRSVDDRSDSRREFRVSRERSSLERNSNLDARNTLSAVRNVRDNEREVTRDRRSVDDRSDSRREFRVSRERSSLERNSNLDARNTLSAVRNVRDNEREVTRDRRSVDDRSDSRREFRVSRERSSLEHNSNLDARNTLSAVRNVRDNEREVTRDRRSVDDRSDSRREFRVSRERSSLERNSNLDARNTLPAVRNVRDNEREVTRDRRSVDDRSDSRREFRVSRERSSLERNINLDARNTLPAVQNVRDNEREVTRDRRSVDDRSDSRREFRVSRERSSLERNSNLDARNTLSAVRNVRDNEREVPRDRRSVDDRSDSRREFRVSRERSSLERNSNLDARNTLSAVRNVRDNKREVTRDRRSVDDRSDSRREFRVSKERSSLERNSNLDARSTLPAVRNVRDNEREVYRDRRSVDDRSDSRREFRVSKERSSLERNSNLDARSTLPAVRNVRDRQREVTRDQRSVDRINSRRERTTLDRSRSLEARNERETRNHAFRNERQTQREHNERSITIRPQIDRLAMERNDRTTESRNRIQADLLRVRENVINEKTENQDSANWQYMFYTLQAAYLCGLLVKMITENSMKSKTRNFSWWLPASNNLIKVD